MPSEFHLYIYHLTHAVMHKRETTFNITLEARFCELIMKWKQDLTVLIDISAI